MKPEKSPFVGYSVEEIFSSEAVSWVVQIGDDVYAHQGQIVFDKKVATHLYTKFLKSFRYLLENGTEQEKKESLRVISSLKMMPLRVQ